MDAVCGLLEAMSVEDFLALCRTAGWNVVEHPLKSRPDARHWHVRAPIGPGTVEVTLLLGTKWSIEVRTNRSSTWAEATAAELRVQISHEP